MLYDVAHRDELKAWLVKSLEPICDAEPEALAAYVLALLNHDAPEQELRKEMVRQLEEFLEGGSSGFVETLFASLRSKSYVPYSSTPTDPSASSSSMAMNANDAAPANTDTGIPIPLDAILSSAAASTSSPGRGLKRGLEHMDGDGSGYQQGPSKGARLENGAVFQPRDGMSRGGTKWLPNGVCRDYHIKGYCARGATCRYSHDDSAFAPGPGTMPFNPMMGPMGMPGPLPGMPFLPMMPFPMLPVGSPTYDPNEAHMDMGPVRPPHQGLTAPYGPPTNGAGGAGGQESGEFNGASGQATSSANTLDQDQQMQSSQTDPTIMNANSAAFPHRGRPSRGGNPNFRARGRGGYGSFSSDHQSFQSDGGAGGRSRNDSKTIVVEKIPAEHLSLEAVNGWFKRFGTVTNVAVDAGGGKALVSFSNHAEAYAAWKGEEAVFGNRFVKVFWHRPMEGQGVAGTRALQASADVVAGIAAKDAPPHLSRSIPPTKPPSKAVAALAAKQEKLEKLIAEQKELMEKLTSASPTEKKEIMANLRNLTAEMTAAKSELSTPPPTATSTKNGDSVVNGKEQKAKELLDMELDAHAQTGNETTAENATEDSETTESLQAKLNRLRAEANALGISDTSSPPYGASSPFRGYRGRGRARGYFRGAIRGGPPRSSMKLDNRTKSLVVKGIKAQNPEYVQAIRGWYELDGQVQSVEAQDDESVVVAFKSRAAAEQALAKGSSLPPPVGSVKLSWHEAAASVPKLPPSSASSTDKKPNITASEDRPPSPRPDDIPDESGWGEVDDGMGMF